MKYILMALLLLPLSSCAYNSRNVMEVSGHNMNFSYGLIAIKAVDRVLILRETNMGKGEVVNNLKDIQTYMCNLPKEESSVETLPPPAFVPSNPDPLTNVKPL